MFHAPHLPSDDLLAYLRDRLPAADVPRVVVLDNAGIHTSKVVKAARPGLARRARSFTTRADLRKAVEDGFDAYRQRLRAKGDSEPRLAA